MIWPQQPQYPDFIAKFIGLVFGDGDVVALGHLDRGGVWGNASMARDQAVAHLLANPDTPNLYFRASAHDGSRNYGACNCVRAHALFLDIDYGSDGHNRKSKFKSLEDALGYVLTLPLRPSVAWHTGHGLQCAYLLKEPCLFPAGGGAADALLLYRSASEGLAKMAMADAAFTPEHAYRVPLTVNSKAHGHEGVPDVRGTLMWCEERRYGLKEIADTVKGYGIDDLLKEDVPSHHQEQDHDICDYASLPQDLRDEIEGGGERSDRLFGIVGWMVRLGYGDAVIASAVAHGHDFVEKFGHRSGGLGAEVRRCAAKIREGRYVYGGRAKSPVWVYNVPVPVALDECEGLKPEFQAMLGRYQDVTGARLLPRVYDASRFHEHLHCTRASGVIESCCGAGKSVWALCHIACRAGTGARCVYVVETVEALHKAADVLDKLLDAGVVGRVHGFNASQCKALSGHEHSWRECRRGDPKSVCFCCQANSACSYFTRDEHERRPVLCMTHAGFIRAMEDGSGLLRDADVIVDEGLSPFDSFCATHAELRRMILWLGAGERMLALLFPGTGIAESTALARYGIAADACDAYARRNFVFRNEAETAAAALQLAPLRNELRTRPLLAGFGANADDPESAKDVLASLLNFFRASVRGDACYAYTETRDAEGWSVQCKRSGFDLKGGGEWKSLWMLNASASLVPFPYPSNMAVYACPDLKGNSSLVTVHVLRANPTKAKQDLSVRLGQVPMRFGQYMRRHKHVLVCADKDSDRVEEITAQVRGLCGDEAQVTVLSRGRIKGVNDAGNCTLALLQGLATFTGVSDCALHACLMYRRTYPDTPHVYTLDGSPNWPGGRMLVPAMRDYYALRSLDEIYQCIWRTAARNDRQVEAVVVVPDSNWLVALYRTVMPELVIGSAYREKAGAEAVTLPDGTEALQQWDWVWDDELYGTGVCALPKGAELAKAETALALGYGGDDPATTRKPKSAWEKNRDSIRALLEGVFEEAGPRLLRRL